MKLSDGTIISKAEVSPHKFGGDPMAEYLYYLSLDSSFPDRQTGNAVEWSVYVSQFGKRLVCCDTQGFVWVEKYDTVADADRSFTEYDEAYAEFEGDDDE